MESILTSIKLLLGIEESCASFDGPIIMHINSALFDLKQLGAIPNSFSITSDEKTWFDLLGETEDLEAVKTLVYFKVKLAFDPPQSSSHLTALKESIKEYEWRLNVEVDKGV